MCLEVDARTGAMHTLQLACLRLRCPRSSSYFSLVSPRLQYTTARSCARGRGDAGAGMRRPVAKRALYPSSGALAGAPARVRAAEVMPVQACADLLPKGLFALACEYRPQHGHCIRVPARLSVQACADLLPKGLFALACEYRPQHGHCIRVPARLSVQACADLLPKGPFS